jgi:hypothetical protein
MNGNFLLFWITLVQEMEHCAIRHWRMNSLIFHLTQINLKSSLMLLFQTHSPGGLKPTNDSRGDLELPRELITKEMTLSCSQSTQNQSYSYMQNLLCDMVYSQIPNMVCRATHWWKFESFDFHLPDQKE